MSSQERRDGRAGTGSIALAEQAAWRVTDAQLVRMEAHPACMRELRDSPDRYLDADLEFHEMIVAAAGNRTADVIMRSMHEPLRRSRRLTNQIPGGLGRRSTNYPWRAP